MLNVLKFGDFCFNLLLRTNRCSRFIYQLRQDALAARDTVTNDLHWRQRKELIRGLRSLYVEPRTREKRQIPSRYAAVIRYMSLPQQLSQNRSNFSQAHLQVMGFNAHRAERLAAWYWDAPQYLTTLFLALAAGETEDDAWALAENL
jgi:hypothetical protein